MNQLIPMKKDIHILYLSSYVPRKCGIATFCRDLAQGITTANSSIHTHVAAFVDKMSENLTFPPEVEYIVPFDHWEYYQSLLQQINNSDKYDLVCLQHEFGLYGGADGEFIIPFLKKLQKPVVTTLHTIMPNPEPNKIRIVKEIFKYSSQVVVMLQSAVEILETVYGVDTSKVTVIHHGVPEFPNVNTEEIKKDLGLEGKIVMTSVNLISPNKGVEYGIRALPEIVKQFPNFVYQIVGETHPVFVKNELGGVDTFRQNLIQLTKDLKVENNVRFVNQYVPVSDLVKYVMSSDFYVTPYLDPQQITSGALAYAIGAGKVCISTPYLYAKEMLKDGRGVLVNFKDSDQISKAIIRIINNPLEKQRREKRTFRLGVTMSWPAIGDHYQKLFMSIINPARPIPLYPSLSLQNL